MATAKKTTTKPKTTTAKKPVAKKPAAKTTTAKKTVAKKPTTKAAAAKKAPVKRATASTSRKKATKPEFMSMQPTRETGYWLIFSMLILVLGIWVLYLTVQINQIYDQIETNNTALTTQPTTEKKKSAE